MRTLDKVVVVNLDRRPDKFAAWIGAAHVMGVPKERVHRFSATDGLDFGSYDDFIDMAAAVFPSWAGFRDRIVWYADDPNRGRLNRRGTLASFFTFQRCLKEIAEIGNRDSMTVFLTDHFFLGRPWSEMRRSVEAMPDFDVFQMFWYNQPNRLFFPEFVEPRGFEYPQLFDVTGSVSYGLGGVGDTGLMLSPRGAAWLLERWQSESAGYSLEYLLYTLSWKSLAEQPGCISAVHMFDWVSGSIDLMCYGFGLDSERLAIDNYGFVNDVIGV